MLTVEPHTESRLELPLPAAPPPSAAGEEQEGGMKLPFDPMRLLRAVRLGRRRILIGALVGLLLGLAYSLWKSETRYTVSVQLLKRYAPPTLQEGLNGEPYKPHQFTNATLASAASSVNVLERVSRKASPRVSVDVLKHSIKVTEDKLTDFVTLSLSGFDSPEATVELSRLWSEEVISFTREMQAEESREIRKVIQTQLDNNQAEIQRLDQEVVEVVGATLSGDMQADTFLRSRADVEQKYEEAKLEFDSISTEEQGLRAELSRQTPAAEQLRQAKSDLEQLRTRYTDENPLVVDQQEKVAGLEAQLKKESERPAGDASDMASTYIGNQLYLTMVQMENKRSALKQQMENLDKQRQLYTKSPEKMSRLMELLQKKEMLHTAQSLLLSRMQEVRIYEENAPASYGIFQPADVDHVVVMSKLLKCVVISILGAFGGAGFALMGVLVVGVANPRICTPKEAASAIEAPLFAAIPHPLRESKAGPLGARIWARWHSATGGGGPSLRAVWTPAPHETESDFWRLMLDQARALLPALMVVDCGLAPLPEIAALPQVSLEKTAAGFCGAHFPLHGASLADLQQVHQFIAKAVGCGVEVWVRMDGEVQEPAVSLLRAARVPLVLAALHAGPAAFYREQTELLRHSRAHPCGVIALNDNTGRA